MQGDENKPEPITNKDLFRTWLRWWWCNEVPHSFDRMEKRIIYNDKRKMMAVIVSLILIAVIVAALVLTRSSSIPLVVTGTLVAGILLVAAASTIRKMVANPALFVFEEGGVTDLTKPDDVIELPWSQVIGIKLQASNNNDLMLDIYGYKTHAAHACRARYRANQGKPR